jgi:exodeoxyribonuclease VIII
METGIYAGISNEDYHAGPGISKSGLDLVARSPLHYWQGYLNPRRDQREETAAMRLGTAIHTMILEPDTFRSRYALIPAEAPRRPTVTQLNAKKPSEDTLTAIAWWEEFDARNADKTIISADDYATVQAIAVGVWGSPLAKAIFKGGVAEQSVFWTDPETGVLCKCRPDWLCEPNPNYAILDLKSAADAGPDGFMRSAYNYGYHRAAAWYLDGVEAAAGCAPTASCSSPWRRTRPMRPPSTTPTTR